MAVVGGYSLDLYCDNASAKLVYSDSVAPGEHRHDEFPRQYYGELGATCRAKAKKAGWRWSDDHTVAVCPRCAKAGFTVAKVMANKVEGDNG